MKRTCAMLLIAIIAVGLVCPTAMAAEKLEYTVSPTSVTMPSDGNGSFSITIPKPETPYDGIQFTLHVPIEIAIKEIKYSYVPEHASIMNPQAPPDAAVKDELYFSIYSMSPESEEKFFAEALTCTINVSYSGTDTKTITVREIKQITYGEGHDVSTLLSDKNAATVTLIPYRRSSVDPLQQEEITETQPPIAEFEKPDAQLDKSNKTAYILGYPDGTFRPSASITRAETASMIYALITNENKANYKDNATQFSDVGTSQWYSEAVGFLAAAEIILGYDDGTFKGGRDISRAEFAAILSRFEGLNADGGMPFPDVPSTHWAYGSILSAYNNKWINGYPDGTFRPDQKITRAEAVAMINRVIDRNIDSYEGYPCKFPDVSPGIWYYNNIVAASSNHS